MTDSYTRTGHCFTLISFLLYLLVTLIQLKYVDDGDVSTVSGFYGPGSFLAWLLAAATTATCSPTKESVPSSRIEIATFIATFVYPLIAAHDAWQRSYTKDQRSYTIRGQPTDAQYYAALSACQWGIVVTSILMFLDFNRWFCLIWPAVFIICGNSILASPNFFCLSPHMLVRFLSGMFSVYSYWHYRLYKQAAIHRKRSLSNFPLDPGSHDGINSYDPMGSPSTCEIGMAFFLSDGG